MIKRKRSRRTRDVGVEQVLHLGQLDFLAGRAYSADDDRWAGRDLPAAHRLLDTWALERGLAWATDNARSNSALSASTEQYLVGPADADDPAKWRTEIAKLVAADPRPTRAT